MSCETHIHIILLVSIWRSHNMVYMTATSVTPSMLFVKESACFCPCIQDLGFFHWVMDKFHQLWTPIARNKLELNKYNLKETWLQNSLCWQCKWETHTSCSWNKTQGSIYFLALAARRVFCSMSSCKLTETHLSPTLALIMLLTLSMIMLTLSKAYTCTYAQHCLGMSNHSTWRLNAWWQNLMQL